MMAGVYQPDGGRILLDGHETTLPNTRVAAEHGIATIHQALADALMPKPEIINRLDSFTIIFHRRKVATQERYGTARDHVEHLLHNSPSVSTTELVEATKLSRTAVQKALNELIHDNIAEKTEPGRSPKQRYRLRK